MSDEMQKVAEKLCHSIAGQMDANLFESIVSLFNQGVLVHYVRSPRHMVDANNFKMTVEAANGVAFEGRQRIIDLEAKLAAAQKEIEELRALLKECETVVSQYADKRNYSYWSNHDVGAFKEEWTMWRQEFRGPFEAEKLLQKLKRLRGE